MSSRSVIGYALQSEPPTDVVELHTLPRRSSWARTARDRLNRSHPHLKRVGSMAIHATIRRYEAVDEARITEVVKNAQNKLLPRVSELPGFQGYYLIEAGQGIVSS